VTAAVEHVAPDGPRVAHWHGSPPPLRVVSVPPLECVDLEPAAPRYAGRFTDRAAYERHKLRNAAAKIRQAHPRMSVDASLVEAHARRSWRELHPGTCVGNGLTLAEHLRGQRVRAERAAKRRLPQERNLRAVIRAAARRHDERRGQTWIVDPVRGPRPTRYGTPPV
jgi:hypothetical protein